MEELIMATGMGKRAKKAKKKVAKKKAAKKK
jgi:hypothetical protein